jgi:hypothetical protein
MKEIEKVSGKNNTKNKAKKNIRMPR